MAAALGMAGDLVLMKLKWSFGLDPTKQRNEHQIIVDSDASHFEIKIEGIPSPENPATGLLTPLSVIATLKRACHNFSGGDLIFYSEETNSRCQAGNPDNKKPVA